MVKSKTKIQKQAKKKTSLDLIGTINLAQKNDIWLSIARTLSGTRKNKVNLNLGEIERKTEGTETVVIPGKVLSSGVLEKKIKIVAISASAQAKEKILKAGGTFNTIIEEIKSNPEGKGIKILK